MDVDQKFINREGITLREIMGFIRRQYVGLLFAVLIPSILTLFVCLLLPKRYQAKATVISPEVLSGGGLSTPFGSIGNFDLEAGQLPSQLIITLMNSRRMREDFIRKFDLINVYGLQNAKRPLTTALEILSKRIDVVHLEGEGIILVSFESPEPKLSADGVNYLIRHINDINEQLNLTDKKPVVQILDAPEVPIDDSFPKTKVSMVISGLFGLFLYLLIYYVKKEWNKSI